MNGVITGGWEYVWAAYGLTGVVLTTYAVSLLLRLRAETRRAERLQAVPVRGQEGR